VQRSVKLCDKNRTTGHGTKSAKAVQLLAEDYMRGVNVAVAPAHQNRSPWLNFGKSNIYPTARMNEGHPDACLNQCGCSSFGAAQDDGHHVTGVQKQITTQGFVAGMQTFQKSLNK
jgi:hypothetical protein